MFIHSRLKNPLSQEAVKLFLVGRRVLNLSLSNQFLKGTHESQFLSFPYTFVFRRTRGLRERVPAWEQRGICSFFQLVAHTLHYRAHLQKPANKNITLSCRDSNYPHSSSSQQLSYLTILSSLLMESNKGLGGLLKSSRIFEYRY